MQAPDQSADPWKHNHRLVSGDTLENFIRSLSRTPLWKKKMGSPAIAFNRREIDIGNPHVLIDVRFHVSGAHAAYCHAQIRTLEPQCKRESNDTPFGGRVRRVTGLRDDTAEGGNIDDVPMPLTHHHRVGRQGAVDDPMKVDTHHLVILLD